MNSLNAALLVNLLGFTVGIALYALLAAMVARHRQGSEGSGMHNLLLMTAALGLLWNVGELFVFVSRDFSETGGWPIISAVSYSALGFLPSVVVHSAQLEDRKTHWLTYAAYCLSGFAAVLHFSAAITGRPAPSDLGLQTLTFGSVIMAAGLLFFNFKQTLEKKTIWAAALLIFAVSALHLSGDRQENSWFVELVAHQSSLPLALVILYQNYRFAFADLFLKRAISLLLLALVAFGLYVFIAAPLLSYHETHDRNDVQAVSLIITLWIATALIYPAIHKLAVWLVDKVILKREDYSKLQARLADDIDKRNTIEEVLETIGEKLASVLTASKFSWNENLDRGGSGTDIVKLGKDDAKVLIRTTEQPFYEVFLGEFHGGRRLLSDETAMLEGVALAASRRIDAMRVSNERFEREFREQKFSKLATEAQLTALRAQINPHFLFNALTTIGYLIQSAPDKAFETLLHLTKLLRSVLSNKAEFCTVADEIRLIESYLDIERARFEERLRVTVDVPAHLEGLFIPSLILQPLVENSIKHAISENKNGGEVRISAELVMEGNANFLKLVVFDTGAGKQPIDIRSSNGVGLQNVRGRLASHYGSKAVLSVESGSRTGTRASIMLPVASETLANA
ncbi:MAG: histidine kinase [Pyrinomonadaceae bacterium]